MKYASTFIGLLSISVSMVVIGYANPVRAQGVPVNSLSQLRVFSENFNDSEVTLAPGEYWIDGSEVTNFDGNAVFLNLGGTNNTYNLAGAEIKLDTRELRGYNSIGRVVLVQISGSNTVVNDLNLKGFDVDLDTDPSAGRTSPPGGQFVRIIGDNLMLNGAEVLTRGSFPYGLGDAFGKGGRPAGGGDPPEQGGVPFLGHDKMSGVLVTGSTDAVVNDLHLTTHAYGHGFFVQGGSTNTTLTNSTVTGELFSTNDVIAHPLYQEYGTTVHGNEIPADQFISGSEGGVRLYSGVSGLTVENVVVTNMRTAFASSLGGGVKTFNNVESYGCENSFDLGSNTTITNAKADGVNGPIVGTDNSNRSNSSIEVELVGDQPFNHNAPLIIVNGDEMDVVVTSDRPAEDFNNNNLFRASQFYYDNWRETNGETSYDRAGYDQDDSVLVNDTNTFLVLGEGAEDNVGRSQGGVISNGKENFYDGITYVLSGSLLEVVHAHGLGNSGFETGAEFAGNNIVFNGIATDETFDDNGTVVQSLATLELRPGIRISDEKLTITGDGIDGIGALYSDGSPDFNTRFGDNNVGESSTIFLDGDAAIGVGVADNRLIVGRVQGVGDLTKSGPGILIMGKSSTYLGDLFVAEGDVVVRPGVVHTNLTVNAGASIAPIGDNGYNTDGHADINGTMDLNGRTDDNLLDQRIGSLNGDGRVTSSNVSGGVLELLGNDFEGVFSGQIDGAVSFLKTGAGFQTFSGDLNHAGTTSVEGGGLLIDGTHIGGGDYTVTGGVLGGDGTVDSNVAVSGAGGIAPGGMLENIVGTFGVGGNYSQDSQAVLWLDLESVSSSDQLLVFGSASLAGSLDLTSVDSTAYSIGDTMTLVNAVGGVLGQFSSIVGVPAGPVEGLASGLAVRYEGNGVSARVTILGDTNFDDEVNVVTDAFTLVSNLGTTSGATFAAGDFNGDGQVDVVNDAFLL